VTTVFPGAAPSTHCAAAAPAPRPSPPRYVGEGGRPLPGVTSILRDLGYGGDLSWVAPERLAELGERGQRVHSVSPFLVEWAHRPPISGGGLPLAPKAVEDFPFAEAMRDWMIALGIERIADALTELVVGADGPRPWRGRLDLLLPGRGDRDGPTVVDYKLRPPHPDDGVQLAAYVAGARLARPELFEGRRAPKRQVVELRETGKYRVRSFDAIAAQCDLEWRRALAAWWERYGADGQYQPRGGA
jgi:hypothetical protein